MADYQVLLRNQKNELFEIIQDVGLDPRNFEWVEERIGTHISYDPDRVVSKLLYRHTPYFYTFDVSSESHWSTRCPGARKSTETESYDTWGFVMNDFRQWAERVKLEIEAPDLWAEAQKYQSIFSLPTQDKIEDIPFSHSEAEQISIALKQFEQTIIDEFGLVGDQLEYVQQKLSYLESKAKEGCPRVDWVNMSIGVLTSIATNLALDPAKAHQLWIAFTEALRPVFQFLLG